MKNHKLEIEQGPKFKFVDKNSSLNFLERLFFTSFFVFVVVAVIIGAYTIFNKFIDKVMY